MQRDVRGALAQRRHVDREDVQAEEEVAAESPLPNGLLEISVRRSDDARVGAQGLRAPHPLELPLLKHAQQGDLYRRREIPDLVQKDRAPARQLETPPAALERAGEGPLLVAEELGGDEPFGQGRAVDLDQRPTGPRGRVMDGPRDEFLARTRLPADENGGIGACHATHALQNRPQPGRGADHPPASD